MRQILRDGKTETNNLNNIYGFGENLTFGKSNQVSNEIIGYKNFNKGDTDKMFLKILL